MYSRAELLKMAAWYDGVATGYREAVLARRWKPGQARQLLELQALSEQATKKACAFRRRARERRPGRRR